MLWFRFRRRSRLTSVSVVIPPRAVEQLGPHPWRGVMPHAVRDCYPAGLLPLRESSDVAQLARKPSASCQGDAGSTV